MLEESKSLTAIRAADVSAEINPPLAVKRRPPRTFAAMQHRNFRLYFGGQLISMAGTWMQLVALGWVVYQLSHSDLMLGVVGFASAIPVLLVSPWAGVVVDRVPRRALLVATQTAAMLLAFILAILAFTGAVQTWHVIALAAALGAVNAFDGPGRMAFVVEMVGREDLTNAIALNSMMMNGARVIGPAIGGLLLATVGAAWCFFINGLSFLAVIAGLLMMRLSIHRAVHHNGSPWQQLIEGLRYVMAHQEIFALLMLALIFSVFGISYSTILPAFAEEILHSDATGLGALTSAIGAGAVTGAFLVARYGNQGKRGRWLTYALIAFPFILALFAYNTVLPVALLLAFGLGVGFMLVFTNLNTLLQTSVDDAMRGRVLALYTLTFFGFAPFGNLAIGTLSQQWGINVTLTLSAIVTLVLAAIVIALVPHVRKMQ